MAQLELLPQISFRQMLSGGKPPFPTCNSPHLQFSPPAILCILNFSHTFGRQMLSLPKVIHNTLLLQVIPLENSGHVIFEIKLPLGRAFQLLSEE
jgi:hypothetical protein